MASAIFIIFLTFFRMLGPLLLSLYLHSRFLYLLETLLTGKVLPRQRSVSLVGTLVFPLILYTINIVTGSALVFGWTKPRYNKELAYHNSVLLALAGPIFYLGLAWLTSYLAYHVFQMGNLEDGSLLSWFTIPWIKSVVEMQILLFFVNLLPFYPFDIYRVFAPLVESKSENLLFLYKVCGVVLTLLAFTYRPTWHLIDKGITAFVSLLI